MNPLFAIVDLFAWWIFASFVCGVILGLYRAVRDTWRER